MDWNTLQLPKIPEHSNAYNTDTTQHIHSAIVCILCIACYNMFAVVHTSKNKQTSGELHICCIGLTGAGHIHLFMNVFYACYSYGLKYNTINGACYLYLDFF